MEKFMQIVKLLPIIIEIIKAVEASIPGTGKGEQKLVAVREMLEMADVSIAQMWPSIEKMIGVLVRLFNNTGVFTK